MTAQVRLRNAAGTLQTVVRVRLRDDNGVLQIVRRIRMRDASNTLRTVYQATAVSGVSPTSVSQTGNTSTIVTPSVSITPTTGTPPYTYSCVKLYGDDIQAVAPLSNVTSFRKTGCVAGTDYFATFQCSATDSLAVTSVVGTVDVAISRDVKDTGFQ